MAALATDIGLDDMINLGLEPDINPQLMEALDAYPAIVGNQENWDYDNPTRASSARA